VQPFDVFQTLGVEVHCGLGLVIVGGGG
jgi:hypothetical protein